MRTKHAIKNITISIFSQVIIILLGFVSRKVFLDSLGTEYLGVNGLLTNVLSAMVLIEGGVGISIVYNLYKPLAEKDEYKIVSLVQLYKKVYRVLAGIMFVICLGLYPFMNNIMKMDNELPGMTIVYWIFVGKSIFSYLYGYKWALINADQKGYVLARTNLIFQIVSMIGKIVILKVTKNYIVYLIIEFVIFVGQNLFNSSVVNKRYPYIKTKENHVIDSETTSNIKNNVKAMFIQNIGSYAIFGTDNILISAFISVKAVGLYSNYTMIISQLASLLNPIIGGIGAGVGNMIATEDKEKTYLVFKITYLVSFWIYSLSTIFLYNLLEPFIIFWIGEQYILDRFTLIILLINFYLTGMRGSIGTFKSKAGLFSQDKYASLIEGIVNLIASLIFIKYFGLVGVFLGTTVSYIGLSFWNQPRIVYKEFFKKSVKEYFFQYLVFAFIALITLFITTFICNIFIIDYGFISLVLRGLICVIIPNCIYLAIFYKLEEFKYLKSALKGVLPNVKTKFKK